MEKTVEVLKKLIAEFPLCREAIITVIYLLSPQMWADRVVSQLKAVDECMVDAETEQLCNVMFREIDNIGVIS